MLYRYRAQVAKVLDGDTVEVTWIDLGFGVRIHSTKKKPLRLRFWGVDAYETALREGTTPEQKEKGLAAKAWLSAQLPPGTCVRLRSVDVADAFGRVLSVVWPDGPDEEALDPAASFGQQILERGWGIVYLGS